MSNNATRFGSGLGYKNTATGVAYEVRKALLKEQEAAIFDMGMADKVADLNAHYRDELRKGMGVAWVHGADLAPLYESGEGMSLHIGTCPVIGSETNTSQAYRGRMVVTQVNRKLCVLRIAD
jgi:hypothetical protein